MLLTIFIRGVIIGVVASIPLGPVGVLCIQRTLSKNQKSGFVSGLGAAIADTIYACVAFFSLTMVMSFIEENMTLIKVIGGMCVMIVGVSIFMSSPVVQIRRNRAGRSNLWQDFMSVLAITLANPVLIIAFIALFAAFGLSIDTLGIWRSMFIIIGVLCGACLWWLILTFIVNLFRKKIRPRHLLWINRISGALIILIGASIVLLMFVNTPIDGVLTR